MAGASGGRGWLARSSAAKGLPPVLGRLARRGGLQLAAYDRTSFLEGSIWRVDEMDTGKVVGRGGEEGVGKGKRGRGVELRGQTSGF